MTTSLARIEPAIDHESLMTLIKAVGLTGLAGTGLLVAHQMVRSRASHPWQQQRQGQALRPTSLAIRPVESIVANAPEVPQRLPNAVELSQPNPLPRIRVPQPPRPFQAAPIVAADRQAGRGMGRGAASRGGEATSRQNKTVPGQAPATAAGNALANATAKARGTANVAAATPKSITPPSPDTLPVTGSSSIPTAEAPAAGDTSAAANAAATENPLQIRNPMWIRIRPLILPAFFDQRLRHPRALQRRQSLP